MVVQGVDVAITSSPAVIIAAISISIRWRS